MKRLTTGFGFHSTAEEVLRGVDISGKRAVVTGGASGIGAETARVLARAGAEVTLAVRDVAAGLEVGAAISGRHPGARVNVQRLDLSDLDNVEQFGRGWSGPLHVLVNNAGIMATPSLETTDAGRELQFATNYLGHFSLALHLKEALAEAGTARVVNVSSSAHLLAPVIFDDIDFRFVPYDPFMAYGQSKSACILHAVGIDRRWRSSAGICANALNPGAIATNLQRHVGGLRTPENRRKNIQEGAATTALLAGSPLLEGVGGRYFEDCNEARTAERRTDDYVGVAPYAVDATNSDRLWDMSLAMIEEHHGRRQPRAVLAGA